MKLKKITLILFLFLFTTLPLKAKVNKSILIASKQLPYIMQVEVQDEKHMRVNFISRELAIPNACVLHEVTPLKKIDLKTDFSCMKENVETFFNIQSDRYVYIHLNRIAKDLDLPYTTIDFHKLSNITDYFSNVIKEMDLSTILHYKTYIESDLDLGDYYDY